MRNKLSLTAALLLGACMVGPDYEGLHFALPASWGQEDAAEAAQSDTAAKKLPLDWWKLFNDPTLTALEEEGLAANDDIVLAAARVAEARAALDLADANLYPTLSAQAGGNRISGSREATFGGIARGVSKPYNDFTLSAVLDYEIDLWGRLRRANESARAQLLGVEANRDAVRLAVASDIATGYFSLLALDNQVQIAKRTVASRQTTFDYQQKQYRAGAVDVLTFRRAEAELAAAEATLPQLQQAQVEQQTALSILLGRSPQQLVETPPVGDQQLSALPVPPVMPAQAPSTLLERRPDVSTAEQQLIAANANIGAAKADYFPTLSLSALIGLKSSDADRLLRGSARNWQLGAAAAMPVLDFGRVSANVDAATARKDQALATYQQTVRNAFGETRNALNAVQTSEQRASAQTRQVKANEETTRVAKLRYDAGYATQLDLLDAQRQLFQAQLDEVSALQQRLSATVNLYKALGGGWSDPALPQEEAVAEAPSVAKSAEKPIAKKDSPAVSESLPEKLPFQRPDKASTAAKSVTKATASSAEIPADAPFKRQRR